MWIVVTGVVIAGIVAMSVGRLGCAVRRGSDDLAVGIGTVRDVVDDRPEAVGGERQIWIEVSSVQGDTFIGRLMQDDADADLSTLRPGLVMLVAFDPAEREQLSLPDDVLAVRASSLALA